MLWHPYWQFTDAGGTPPIPPVVDTPTGGKGDNEKGKRGTFKPLNDLRRKPKQPEGRKSVEQRVDDTANIVAELLAERETLETTAIQEAFKRAELALRGRVDLEIDAGVFAREQQEEDELIMLILIAASV